MKIPISVSSTDALLSPRYIRHVAEMHRGLSHHRDHRRVVFKVSEASVKSEENEMRSKVLFKRLEDDIHHIFLK